MSVASIDMTRQIEQVRKLSILFVDDDDEVRESMARYLGRRIDKVQTAHNGEAGISSFMTHRPDLVISDIRMGEMDGLTMCRTIRETAPDLPVILISAHNESEILLSSIDMGITKFMVKPVDTDVLMKTIASVAQSLELRHDLDKRLQQMNLMLNEADYESENIKGYISRYLEANHHDEISCIRHLNIPKLDVSGDFYSVAKHGDDLYVMLADGAGHGLSAVIPALQMPRVFQKQAARGFSLLAIAAELNQLLNEQHFTGHFVATTLIRINPCEHFIEVLNCGNPAALISDDNGVPLYVCNSQSPALGVVDEESFSIKLERFIMERGARIYLFTDGLTDMLQAYIQDFDLAKLQNMIEGSSGNAFDTLAAKIDEAERCCKVDDVTLLEIKFDLAPAAIEQHAILQESVLQDETEQPVALDQMTLLYVEDDDLTREYLAHYFSRRFAMVYVARDGLEGLEIFRKHSPQIIVSDIKMPQMNGLQMADEIRKLNKQVPIIIISGSDHAENAEKMFDMGVSRFHMKPLDPGRLIKTIQTCVRQADMQEQQRLSSSAFENSALAVLTADQNRRVVALNPAFCRVTGYTLEEVGGHSPMLLSSGKHDANYFQMIWKILEESGHWSGELLCQHKNGSTVSEWLSASAVKGIDNAVTGYHFIFSDASERQMTEAKVRQLTRYDSLTQLPNREMFAERVNELLHQSAQQTANMSLLYINIDRFIEINNVLGVHVGDEVLFTVAQRLLAGIKTSDVVCRMGGDEFAALMPGCGRDEIEQIVVKLSDVIKQCISVNGHEIQLRFSIGIGVYPSDGESYEELLKSASSAMNQAQLAGGDAYRFFDKIANQREERHVILQQSIKFGLQKNEFFMLYQPKYSFSQNRVVGAEALVRWNHPALGLISPVEFIPLAESSGAVIEMSAWIINTVCAQLAEWRRMGLPQVPVSINISPVHFWRGDLVADLQGGLQRWDICPAMLPIEVTEGVVMDTSEKTLQLLARLQSIGFHLSIDDFGTGYSSLKYLKDLPISELKIDRSFVIEIPEVGQPDDLSRTAVPRAIIQLATELNLAVVAEGVETEKQRDWLLEHGCDVIQGYLFSKPISAAEFAGLLSG